MPNFFWTASTVSDDETYGLTEGQTWPVLHVFMQTAKATHNKSRIHRLSNDGPKDSYKTCERYGRPNKQEHIVTCSGLKWLIIMGSGFDDWIYWHFFTITTNYNSSHIELLLNSLAVELRLLSEVCSLKNLWLSHYTECTNELPFITATGPECISPCRTVNCPLLICLLSRECIC
jgi:hypothetical protein